MNGKRNSSLLSGFSPNKNINRKFIEARLWDDEKMMIDPQLLKGRIPTRFRDLYSLNPDSDRLAQTFALMDANQAILNNYLERVRSAPVGAGIELISDHFSDEDLTYSVCDQATEEAALFGVPAQDALVQILKGQV